MMVAIAAQATSMKSKQVRSVELHSASTHFFVSR